MVSPIIHKRTPVQSVDVMIGITSAGVVALIRLTGSDVTATQRALNNNNRYLYRFASICAFFFLLVHPRRERSGRHRS